MQEAQNKLNQSDRTESLLGLYNQLHFISLKYQLQAFSAQASQLAEGRWANIKIVPETDGLLVKFWNATSFDGNSFDLKVSLTKQFSHLSWVYIGSHRLDMKVNGPFENRFSKLEEIQIKKLDIESVLCQVTDQITKNIMESWHSELKNAGFQVSLSSSVFDSENMMVSLQVLINGIHPINVSINPRTGYANLSLLNMIQSDMSGESDFLLMVVKDLEAVLNSDYSSAIAVMRKLSLAVSSIVLI
jgi:hypothetical protein